MARQLRESDLEYRWTDGDGTNESPPEDLDGDDADRAAVCLFNSEALQEIGDGLVASVVIVLDDGTELEYSRR